MTMTAFIVFHKDIRDGKLGRYTLDTLGEIHGDN